MCSGRYTNLLRSAYVLDAVTDTNREYLQRGKLLNVLSAVLQPMRVEYALHRSGDRNAGKEEEIKEENRVNGGVRCRQSLVRLMVAEPSVGVTSILFRVVIILATVECLLYFSLARIVGLGITMECNARTC